MKTIRPEICVYCGGTKNLTDEHGPPKLVFPEPRPSDLITVRACDSCNKGGSKDAEYFRLCLCLDHAAKKAPSVMALRPAVRRSLQRPQAQGFRNAVLSAFSPENDGFKFRIEVRRIHQVIKRTVQCLYLYETGIRIPDTHYVTAVSDLVLQNFTLQKRLEFRETFVLPLADTIPTIIADGQFAYSVIHMLDPFMSAWALQFYGTIAYVGLTGPKNA